MAMGEAAGTAAATDSAQHISAAQVDVSVLRARLAEHGVIVLGM